ncbi:unnamed protein product [Zymoseptoria tritici ST99CH_3D7]|uniref:AB hydrolase-1 domain-containing protein n=2 Tax=Zymoseptoria tritici TaxID=1047171 RepID=A0A1X7RQA1_ZYMT9|nr:unnamed protein product [Zymoseptoria tritici ST99CH_3D7]SMR50585.1 unnamed protein product [Zymoseptoria tritici ST99CH_1E4]
MSSKPGVVIVHGAWHSPSHWDNVTSKLQAEGYTVEVPALPSVAKVAAEDVFAKDVAAVKQAIQKITKTGRNVVLVMHSYGGICGSEAVAEVLEDRKASMDPTQGRIVHLLYVAAIIVEKGMSVQGAELSPHEWEVKENVIHHLNPQYRFYNTTSQQVAQISISLMGHQALESFSTPTQYRGWADYDLPLTYIACLQDHALWFDIEVAKFFQRIDEARVKDFTKVEIDCDHSPWVNSGQKEFFEAVDGVLEKASKV